MPLMIERQLDVVFSRDLCSQVPASISLLPLATKGPGTCVCPEKPKPFGQASGTLVYHPVANQSADTGRGAVGIGAHKCADWPHTNLIEQRNPTCDIRYYVGGAAIMLSEDSLSVLCVR